MCGSVDQKAEGIKGERCVGVCVRAIERIRMKNPCLLLFFTLLVLLGQGNMMKYALQMIKTLLAFFKMIIHDRI